MINNFSIENFLDLTNYVTDASKKHRKDGKFGGGPKEFFTPYSIFFKWDFENWKYIDDKKQ